MKKKLLPLAVLAGLAGGMSTAQAVNVNPDGLGEVLLYPFYSVEGGNDTYINVVNTTNQVKAVKVRILEAMNSQEVLDFNLYLSPNDHWSAVILDNPNGSGAILRTADTSCTAPAIPANGVAFREFEYAADSDNSIARTREGYVEIIEMGVLDAAVVPAQHAGAIHTGAGVPANCGAIISAWQAGGVWANAANTGINAPTGGLYGYGVLINVAEGTNATYDATALDAFAQGIALHTNTGSLLPSLNSAAPTSSVFDNGATVTSAWAGTAPAAGVNAVSSVLMHDNIANDYVLEPTIGAGTDWVVTFPTKRFYVNGAGAPFAPFTNAWNPANSTACEVIGINYFDREERGQTPSDIDFSPLPPGTPALSLCYEANVLTFNNSNVLNGSARVNRNLEIDGFNNGWLNINFQGTFNGIARTLTATSGEVYQGLPVIGFAVQKYVNGTLPGGVLSNYAGLVNHKATRLIN
ncbi:hypothetical protein [Nitrincola alkalilacustris]|uniref:hypothetical protein n=1 Tax=Nitrincola alkalilacustris TaxID=1571224 RepID=UPI00124BE586|nr:hypothetical protein [Nitrincola alkalilacustris]